MKDSEAEESPRAPYYDLYDVLAHHGAAFGTLGVGLAEMQAQEIEAYLIDIAEDEPQRDDLNDAEETQRDIRGVDKLRSEDSPRQRREVEDVGSPEYGDKQGEES